MLRAAGHDRLRAQRGRQGGSGCLLRLLGERGINEVHVEAGFKLNGSLLREGCVDELLIYLAPMLVGDAAAGALQPAALTRLEGAIRLDIRDLRRIGPDLRLIARPPSAGLIPRSGASRRPAHRAARGRARARHCAIPSTSVEQQQAAVERAPATNEDLERLGSLDGADDADDGANTPITAQRTSSMSSPSGNRQW